jgi:hypothetical protein
MESGNGAGEVTAPGESGCSQYEQTTERRGKPARADQDPHHRQRTFAAPYGDKFPFLQPQSVIVLPSKDCEAGLGWDGTFCTFGPSPWLGLRSVIPRFSFVWCLFCSLDTLARLAFVVVSAGSLRAVRGDDMT